MMPPYPAAALTMPTSTEESAGRKNMLLLIQLRWIAVAGQMATILLVHYIMGITLPLRWMLVVPVLAVALNITSLLVLRRRDNVTQVELFLALLFDVGALTVQLYLSGGAVNPFISLYLLQVVIGAILLDSRAAWVIAAITTVCSAMLAIFYRPLALPFRLENSLLDMHILGTLVCFALIAALLMQFVTRINRNLQAREAHLAAMRQRAAEEDHIVRMGLLASGAAHELGTPLSSLAVILNDWQQMQGFAADPQVREELDEMQAAVWRCKAIVSGILVAAGEARGEAPAVTTMRAFLDEIVEDWRGARAAVEVAYSNNFDRNVPIVADPALKQILFNVLDNAADASPEWIGIYVTREQDRLRFVVRDHGPGFAPDMLANIGKPYQSSKGRLGGGLGLFLVVNVMRKLGGEVQAENMAGGGAAVTLTLPLATLELKKADDDDG
ncbi:histidine kinase [Sphingomonas sp. KC8]|nr:ATP-binding protein [Sphingomonas sp. KC8]ARS27536.1 histidine kinase [Sphingomonas sp. KC8]